MGHEPNHKAGCMVPMLAEWRDGMSPKRPCLEPGCGSYAAYRGRCVLHSKERERSIDRTGRATYNSKRWRVLRIHKLHQNPFCERCKNALATDVHHRTALAEGGEQYEMENLESCCHACHSRITRQEQLA